MARRRYLVSYDIRDQRRLRAVAKCAEAFGDRLQYSVFVCDLSDVEVIKFRVELDALIRATHDSVVIVDLGTGKGRFTWLGRKSRLPDEKPMIV